MSLNPIQVSTIHGVSSFIMFLGKIFVVAFVTLGAFVYQRQIDTTRMWFVPIILIAIAAYFLSSCFMLIYEMTISTLLFCYLEDIQRNPSTDRHMSKKLESFVSDVQNVQCCCCCDNCCC